DSTPQGGYSKRLASGHTLEPGRARPPAAREISRGGGSRVRAQDATGRGGQPRRTRQCLHGNGTSAAGRGVGSTEPHEFLKSCAHRRTGDEVSSADDGLG